MPNAKTLEDPVLRFVTLFNINCSQVACWCTVTIAAGGKSWGSGRTRGGSVRTAFWPVCLHEQLVPGRSGALSFYGTEYCLALLKGRGVRSVGPSAGKARGGTVQRPRGKPQRSAGLGERGWQQLRRTGGAQVNPLWHPASLTEGVAVL